MTYAIEHIARTLRNAREARGLSQRALSAKAGIAQGHISKIENGTVDLRISSLVELARVLDLELELVPRKAVTAVHAIVRRDDESAHASVASSRRARKELKQLQDNIARATRAQPTVVELAQLQRQVRELRHLPIPGDRLDAIRKAAAAAKAFLENTAGVDALQDALMQLRRLRNVLVHAPSTSHDARTVRPAYSLDDDDHG